MSWKLEALVWRKRLPMVDKVVLKILADHADQDGTRSWPSVARVAAIADCNRKTVTRTFARLQDGGLIQVVREADKRTHRPTEYRLCVAAITALPDCLAGIENKGKHGGRKVQSVEEPRDSLTLAPELDLGTLSPDPRDSVSGTLGSQSPTTLPLEPTQDSTLSDGPKNPVESELPEKSSSKVGNIEDALTAWNRMADEKGLPNARGAGSGTRAKRLTAALREYGVDGWQTALNGLASAPWCCGNAESGWRADIDWLLRPDRFLSMIERGDQQATNTRNAATDAREYTPDQWRRRLEWWVKDGRSPDNWHDDWRGAPGMHDCIVPADVLAEFGYGTSDAVEIEPPASGAPVLTVVDGGREPIAAQAEGGR